MASYTFNFFEPDGSTPLYVSLVVTINGFTSTAGPQNNLIILITEDSQVVITATPLAPYTFWSRSIFLPLNDILGQTEFNVIFDDDPDTVNTNNDFIMINRPCTSNVQVVDNVAQNGVYNIVWNFGDGTSASGTSVSHTYARPGQYVITKTITFCTEP